MSNFNFSQFEPTYNKAIDYCANIIGLARTKNIPIEALSLSPLYFEWFKSGIKTMIENNKGLNWEEMIINIDLVEDSMQFDGVNIEKGKFQSKPVVIKYFSEKPVDLYN